MKKLLIKSFSTLYNYEDFIHWHCLFSKNILDEIRKSKNTLVGVIGKRNNKFNSDYFDIPRHAKKSNIKGIYTNNINSKKTVSWIRKKTRFNFLHRME